MTDGYSPETFRYRIRREASGAVAFVSRNWAARRWLRWATYGALALLIAFFALWMVLAKDLPDAT